jgi:hypothetical protein
MLLTLLPNCTSPQDLWFLTLFTERSSAELSLKTNILLEPSI